MEKINDIFKKIDSKILLILKIITITCIILIACLVVANIFMRRNEIESLRISLHWFDEIIELLYAYLVFYGAAALWMSKEHFKVGNWLSKWIKNEKLNQIYKIILEFIVLCFAVIFFYYSYQLAFVSHISKELSNAFQIPKMIFYSCMPISGLIMVIYSIIHVILEVMKFFNPKIEEKKDNI